jgi:hypothetical protein
VNDNEEEILDKIEEGHRRGEHYTRMAGCSLCTEQFAGGGSEPAAAGEVARGRRSARDAGRRGRADGCRAAAAGRARPAARGDRRRTADASPVDGDVEKTLGDVALEDAQQALDDLLTLAERGIVIPNAQKAIVHALVGVVRALAGIEEAIYALAAQMIDVDPGPSLRIVETPVRAPRMSRRVVRRRERMSAERHRSEPPSVTQPARLAAEGPGRAGVHRHGRRPAREHRQPLQPGAAGARPGRLPRRPDLHESIQQIAAMAELVDGLAQFDTEPPEGT